MIENEDWQEENQPQKTSLLYKIIAVLVALGLIIASVQVYFSFIRPEPINIPTLNEVKAFLGDELKTSFTSHHPEEVRQVVDAIKDDIKPIANFIAAQSCREFDRLCQSKAIFYFVRNEIRYVPDNNFHDQLENPLTVLKTGGADCEDMAVLLIAMQKAIGNEARLVFVPGHAYAQVSINDYKNGAWLNLEGTCKDCQFGEIPDNTSLQRKEFFEI